MTHNLRDGKRYVDVEEDHAHQALSASSLSALSPASDGAAKTAALHTSGIAKTKAAAVSQQVSPPLQLTSLGRSVPAVLRLPTLIVTSYIIGAITHEAASRFIGSADLRLVSNKDVTYTLIASSLGWRAVELAVAYIAGLDALDATTLTFLTHTPQAYLLQSFYHVPALNTTLTLLLTSLSTYIPFTILYKSSPHHDALFSRLAPLHSLNGLWATAIYGATLLANQYTWLPRFLVTHFNNLRTIAPAHDSTLFNLPILLLPAGFLASSFVFSPVSSPVINRLEQQAQADAAVLDPAEAGLWEQVKDNALWYKKYTPRAQELLKRGYLLVAMTWASAGAKALWEIEGNELVGCVGWGGVWAFAAASVVAALGWGAEVF